MCYLRFPEVPSSCLIVPPFLVSLWHTEALRFYFFWEEHSLLYQCEVLTLLLLCSDFNLFITVVLVRVGM